MGDGAARDVWPFATGVSEVRRESTLTTFVAAGSSEHSHAGARPRPAAVDLLAHEVAVTVPGIGRRKRQ